MSKPARPKSNKKPGVSTAQVAPQEPEIVLPLTVPPSPTRPTGGARYWAGLILLGIGCLGLLSFPLFFPLQTSDPTNNGQVNFWLIFLIGLTTGGLTCMVVQGGLLAATIAQREREHEKEQSSYRQATPILAFLGAKLVAYTLLGAGLGWLGSFLSLSPTMQAILNILAGLFMLATALNLLQVHPIFRYAAIQPPRWAMRRLRQESKSTALLAPAFLGFLTILIPCGTTQAMEVLAISSGNPLSGSLIMAAFVLGTSPVFFTLGYFATKLGELLHRRFLKFAAIGIIVLAVMSINGALNVLDAPVTLETVGRYLFDTSREDTATQENTPIYAATPAPGQASVSLPEVRITALNTEYLPSKVQVASGQPFKIVLVTKNTVGCTRSILFRSLGIRRTLPINGETVIEVAAQKPGVIRYTCSMGMYSGTITVV